MSFYVVIPARYQSSRLPGKALLEIAGQPMIQHVYASVKNCGAEKIIVATDDERIYQKVIAFGGNACMTAITHPTGTDRIAEVAERFSLAADDVIVNVQGDKPLTSTANVQQVAENLNLHAPASIATLCEPCKTMQEILDPNVVKVVMDCDGFALYFSRSPIAWQQAFADANVPFSNPQAHLRHIGLYAYRVNFLEQYRKWGQCALERMESLEQLRALWYRAKIHVALAKEPSAFAVDTHDDLQHIRNLILQKRL